MYSQLIYFVVVLILFSFQPPPGAPAAGYTNALYILAAFLLFAAYCRASFNRLLRRASRGMSQSSLSIGYYRIQARLSIMALVWLFLYVYAFNLKLYFRVIPGFEKFTTISGLAGLIFFLAHLCVIWIYAHPAHKVINNSAISRSDFIRAQLSFVLVVLAPWLIISTVTDLLQLVNTPAFLASDSGQILIVGVALFGFVLFGPWLMVRLWRCEPLRPDYLRHELERYCAEHNFRVGGLLGWPILGGEMLTAGVVGILPGLRYILLTSGLADLLDTEELKAVVAHEMGHVRKKHLLMFMAMFIIFILIVYNLSDILVLLALSNRTVLGWALAPGFGSIVVSLLQVVPLIILVVLFFRFIFGFFLRNSERQADLYALKLLGSPLPLVSSFEKIARYSGKIDDMPNWHHYSIRQRINFLFAAFEKPDLIRGHNRKLYGAGVAFLVTAAVLFTGLGMNRGEMTAGWRSELVLRTLELEIANQPGNAELQAAYGGLLFEKARYSEAESVLRAALMHDSRNATILNNLAWLYATTPAPHRNPEEALELALEAVSINPEPHILDTLAEAYYINGRYEEALAAIEEALAKSGPDRGHFLKQREKFQRALHGQI